MRFLIAASLSALFVAGFDPADTPSSRPAAEPTSRPAADTPPDAALRAKVERLARQLGDARFKVREAAHRELAALGDAAARYLVPFVTSSDPEIASRAVAILGTPRDLSARVDLAIRLLGTADPDWMERAVYMLFESPADVCDLFVERTAAAVGVDKAAFGPVAEYLLASKRRYDLLAQRHERMRDQKPEAVQAELRAQKDTDRYNAEAAYWSSYEAVVAYLEAHGPQDSGVVTTRPAP